MKLSDKNKNVANSFVTIARYTLFILIINKVYQSTGFYTAFGIFFLFIQLEYVCYIVIKIMNAIKSL